MKATLKILLAVALLMSVAALPAGADAPASAEFETTFPAINACTGAEHLVTLSWDIKIHEHRNNEVAKFDTTVTTSDGGAGVGQETQVMTGDKLINALSIRVTDGDWVYMVKGQRRIDLETGEVTMANQRVSCIKP